MKFSKTTAAVLIALAIGVMEISAAVPSHSPYQLSPPKDLILTGSAVIIGLAGFSMTGTMAPLTPPEIFRLSPQMVNVYDRPAAFQYSQPVSEMSDFLMAGAILLPSALFTLQKIRDDWKVISIIYLETLLLSNSFPQLSKGLFPRIRPYVYNPEVPLTEKLDKNARWSFYSRHTSNAFASAVFLTTVFSSYAPDSRWKATVWAGSLGLACLQGYLRYRSGKHFPSDILMGAAAGSAIGYFIPRLHRSPEKPVNISVLLNNSPPEIRIHFHF